MQHNTFTGDTADISAIKTIIQESYIKGIHIDLDEKTVRKGFHPDFSMIVLQDDEITKVSIPEWIERMEDYREKNPGFSKIKTTHEVSMAHVTGNAATVRIDVFKDAKHTFTDYMLLYKFENGWKIVSKIFYKHN